MIRFLITLCFSTSLAFAKLHVAVSIAPQKYFVEQIMGEKGEVVVLVPTGASPATYAPRPSQLRTLQESTLYFTIGVPFEQHWLARFQSANPKMKLIDTSKGINKHTMHETHKHDEHKHEGLDPHIWLSPALVKVQAKNILDALSLEDPKQKKHYHDNFQKFIKKIDALDSTLHQKLDTLKQKKFIVFHPSFGYFAHDYNLTQTAIEKEGKEPSLRYIKRLIGFAKKEQIKTIFIAPQFTQKAANHIAKLMGGSVSIIDPLAEDWAQNLLNIADSFEKAD